MKLRSSDLGGASGAASRLAAAQVMYGLVASGFSPHPAFVAACEASLVRSLQQVVVDRRGRRAARTLSAVQWRYARLIYQQMGRGMGEELAVAMVAST